MYFWGVVNKNDYQNGNIKPSYILYAGKRISEYKSGLYFSTPSDNKKKYLVNAPFGIDHIVDYLSAQQYDVKGALFLFECDKRGNQLSTGSSIFIKLIPDKSSNMRTRKKILMEALKEANDMKTNLAREPTQLVLKESSVKPKLK